MYTLPPFRRPPIDLAGGAIYNWAMDSGNAQMEQELGEALRVTHAPTMGAIAKVRYSHDALIDLMLANPTATQTELGAKLGYTGAWISNISASDAFKARFAARRAEITDPVLLATINERFESLAARSLERLMQKLDAPEVSDQVVLKAVELGARAVGIGGFGVAKLVAPPAAPEGDRLSRLAERLLIVGGKGETVDGEIIPQN